MLAVSFFALVFSSLLWLILSIKYVAASLAGRAFFAAGADNILAFVCIVCLPVFLVWLAFFFVNQYLHNKAVNEQLSKLFSQMKKNQDYSDLLARILIETEQQVKDGFMLGKFDLLVADMNELLAEIIHCANLASAEQIERLWNKVQNGGKWSFGKVVIEINNAQPNFQMRIYEKASADYVLAGTIMEFCARYLAVVSMLEKHDKEKVFLNIIETGVMGKVFSIFAPVADEVRKVREAGAMLRRDKEPAFKPNPQPKAQPMPRMSAPVSMAEDSEPKKSIFNKLEKINPFKKKESDDNVSAAGKERDPFSIALERSFGNAEEDLTPRLSLNENNLTADEMAAPRLSPATPTLEPQPEPAMPEIVLPAAEPLRPRPEETAETLSDTQRQLNSLKKEWAEMRLQQKAPLPQAEEPAATENNEEENTAYPFGGWVDEDNYNK